MSVNPLLDGNLSLTVGGVEYIDKPISDLQCEDAAPGGDASLSFRLWVTNPFTVMTDYPQLMWGTPVVLSHAGVCLFAGQICNDPTVGYAGEQAYVDIECDGTLGLAKRRGDYAITFVDTEVRWQEHPRRDRRYSIDVDDGLRISMPANISLGTGVRAAATWLIADGLDDTQQITKIEFDYDVVLGSSFTAGIYAAPSWQPLQPGASGGNGWTTVWSLANTAATGHAIVTVPAGTRALCALLIITDKGTTTGERYLQITDLHVFGASASAKRVDEAMLTIMQTVTSASTSGSEAVGYPLDNCVIEPFTTRAEAIQRISLLTDWPLDWGWYGPDRVPYVYKRPTNNTAIRALNGSRAIAPRYCYLLDATTPGVEYDVHKDPEVAPNYVRVTYNYKFRSILTTPSPIPGIWPDDWSRSSTNVSIDNTVPTNGCSFKLTANAADRKPNCQSPPAGSNPPGFPVVAGRNYRACIAYRTTLPLNGDTILRAYARWYDASNTWLSSDQLLECGLTGEAVSLARLTAPSNAAYAAVYIELDDTVDAQDGDANVWAVRLGEDWADGMVRQLCRPGEPTSATARVDTLDLTGVRPLSVAQARAAADLTLAWERASQARGTITIRTPTVPIEAGGERLAAYIRAGDYIETQQTQAAHGPLLITRRTLDVESGTVTLTIDPEPIDVAQALYGHERYIREPRWRRHKKRRRR